MSNALPIQSAKVANALLRDSAWLKMDGPVSITQCVFLNVVMELIAQISMLSVII